MKKITVLCIVGLMFVMVISGVMIGNVSAASPDEAPVSLGLHVLAEQSAMGKYGVSGGEIAFSPEDFERAMNQKRLDYLTVEKLPNGSLGTLRLGSEAVSEGQSISRENIHKLSYVPKGEGILEDSFVFSTGRGYEIECALYMLDEKNHSPVAAVAGELSLSVSTHRNVSVWGSLSGYDSDGDDVRFEVVSYPEKGILTFMDSENGEFCYTPSAEYTGKDSFKYVVIDKYGNYSAASEVLLRINRVKLESVLEDMGGNKAHTDAITMVEKGIMNAEKNASGTLSFSPEKTLSREEFLVMAMKAVGINPNSYSSSGFADDSDVSVSAKSYVAFAKEKGYVSGTKVGDEYYFYPDRTVTAAEAAVIIDNIIGGAQYVVNQNAALAVFADEEDIPAWAEESMLTLKQVGVIKGNSGYLYPDKELTRDNAASLLAAMIKLTDK